MNTKPRIVTLCGSTRFYDAFHWANFQETLAGKVVLTIGCDTKSDEGLKLTLADKARLDRLHLDKIGMSDEIYVMNVGGYVGDSTRSEIAYAMALGKGIRYLEEHTEQCMERAYIATKARNAWADKWPFHCAYCHGAGAFYSSDDPSPDGVSLSGGSMVSSQPCPNCIEEGVCPRCGLLSVKNDVAPCRFCNWNFDDEQPSAYQCNCAETLDVSRETLGEIE